MDSGGPPLIVDVRNEQSELDIEPVRLLEGIEYRYVVELADTPGRIENDHPEIFVADDQSGRTGRLRPRQRVGLLRARFAINGYVGTAAVEVRARRLDYLSEFRWMLRDIADVCTETLLESFAATEQRFVLDESATARTAYQRFCFLKSLLADEAFVAAIELVRRRPYVAWVRESERRPTAQGIPPSSRVVRSLTRPGPRMGRSNPEYALAKDFPTWIDTDRGIETLDNPPNRFVKFSIERWYHEATSIVDILSATSATPATIRGIAEATDLQNTLERLLSATPFSEVSKLDRLPIENPVLLRREGYREVTRAFFQSELAARLAWDGGEQVYSAGQRNVATLYEYWVYLKLVEIIGSVCDEPLPLSRVIEVGPSGMQLQLRQGKTTRLEGVATRNGRVFVLSFSFNKSFSSDSLSWTETMRPDASLHIALKGAAADDFRSVWLHFDAKYRIESLGDLFDDGSGGPLPGSSARREDLLKMHAYRDAIRGSAGAYVIYPGTEDVTLHEYQEILPGLGAFALRPVATGSTMGAESIRSFISDVLDHLATQVSEHERQRYWTQIAYAEHPSNHARRTEAAEFLSLPPADVRVLLGYVKSFAHFEWIARNGLYNVRADGRTGSLSVESQELGAELAILYGRHSDVASVWRISGQASLVDRTEMVERRYPSPAGSLYFCFPVEPEFRAEHIRLTRTMAEYLRDAHGGGRPRGAPVVMSWAAVLDALGNKALA